MFLDVSGCNLGDAELSAAILLAMPQLRALSAADNDLTKIPDAVFSHSKLSYVDLRRNRIQELDSQQEELVQHLLPTEWWGQWDSGGGPAPVATRGVGGEGTHGLPAATRQPNVMGYTRTAPGSTKVARGPEQAGRHGGSDGLLMIEDEPPPPQTTAKDRTRILMPTPKHRLRLAGNLLTRVPGLSPGGFIADPELTEDVTGVSQQKGDETAEDEEQQGKEGGTRGRTSSSRAGRKHRDKISMARRAALKVMRLQLGRGAPGGLRRFRTTRWNGTAALGLLRGLVRTGAGEPGLPFGGAEREDVSRLDMNMMAGGSFGAASGPGSEAGSSVVGAGAQEGTAAADLDGAENRWDWRWALLRGGLAPSSNAGAAPSEWLLKAHEGLWTEAVAGTGVGHEAKNSAGGLWMCIPEAALLEEAERRWASEIGTSGLLAQTAIQGEGGGEGSDGGDNGAVNSAGIRQERRLGEMHDALLAMATADGWDGGHFSMGGMGAGAATGPFSPGKGEPKGALHRATDALIAEGAVAGPGDPVSKDEESHESAILHAVALRRMIARISERVWRATRGAADPAAFVAAAR